MRIAYLTTEYPAVSHTFIRRELLEIERRGHAVLRLAIREAPSPLADPVDRDEHGRTLHCLSQPLWQLLAAQVRTLLTRPLAFLRALRLTLRMGWRSERGVARHLAYLAEAAFLLQVLLQERVKHVHVHFGTNAAAVARLVRQLGGPAYSFTAHGIETFDAPRSLDIAGKADDAAFVVAVCDYCAAQLRRWVPFECWARIHVVRCTVGEDFFESDAPVDAASRTLVCVGRLCPEKGQLLLVDAMRQLADAGVDGRLVLAGDGEMRPIIERRIDELGLRDRVDITGWIAEADVRRHLLAARALVLPSFAEGLPMVIMEAFALGRPAISTYVAGIPELVRPGENGWLVPAGNFELLAAAMREALDAPVERLSAMGQAGRKAVIQRHNTRTEGARLERLFLRAVKGSAAP